MSQQLTASFSVPSTLGCPATASLGGIAQDSGELANLVSEACRQGHHPIIIGEGSNLLVAPVVQGAIIVNQGGQLQFDGAQVVADAGVSWQTLVDQSIAKGLRGLENLTAIPGTVGACPVQNIGAYGVEVSEFIDFVDYLPFDTLEPVRLSNAQCNFGYRDSVFKGELRGKGAILRVAFTLSDTRPFTLGYGPLQQLQKNTNLDANTVAQQVAAIRWSKLPKPSDIPNAGSFFKNPVVTPQFVAQQQDAGVALGPVFEVNAKQVKLSAGWLIESLGFKGKMLHNCCMYANHALVMTNPSRQPLDSVIALAQIIIDDVLAAYGVVLQIEPQRIGSID